MLGLKLNHVSKSGHCPSAMEWHLFRINPSIKAALFTVCFWNCVSLLNTFLRWDKFPTHYFYPCHVPRLSIMYHHQRTYGLISVIDMITTSYYIALHDQCPCPNLAVRVQLAWNEFFSVNGLISPCAPLCVVIHTQLKQILWCSKFRLLICFSLRSFITGKSQFWFHRIWVRFGVYISTVQTPVA